MQSQGLPHVDFEDLVSRELQCKVLEVDEEVDRLVLSNRKNNISSAKLSYNVRLSPPLQPTPLQHTAVCFLLASAIAQHLPTVNQSARLWQLTFARMGGYQCQ